jgi:hypothetical protein
MQFGKRQIPAWVLLLVILGGAAAAVAGATSGATVLTGDTQVAVADKLLIEKVEIGIVNAGFETGDLTGWEVGGLAKVVEVLTETNFIPPITPPQGDHFVLLATGHNLVNSVFGPDLDGNGVPDSDTSILSQTFTIPSSATIHLWWSFLTYEEDDPLDDFFFIELNGNKILTGSVPGPGAVLSPFPNTPSLDDVSYKVDSPGLADENHFEQGRTEWQSFNINIPSPGTYNLTFVVADQSNHEGDTGLLIDLSFESSAVAHLANDRQSYMANFIADEGDTILINLNVTNLAGIATIVKIVTDAPDEFDVGYSLLASGLNHIAGPANSTNAQLGSTLRKIDSEWVLFLPAGSSVELCQYIWIKTKPPTPPGQYEVSTWIEQKFQ